MTRVACTLSLILWTTAGLGCATTTEDSPQTLSDEAHTIIAEKEARIQELEREVEHLNMVTSKAIEAMRSASQQAEQMMEYDNWPSAWLVLNAAIEMAHQDGEPSEYMAAYVEEIDALLKSVPAAPDEVTGVTK